MNIMKKLLCVVLAVMSLTVLTACGGETITAYEPAVRESAVMTCGEETIAIEYIYDENGLLVKEVMTAADGSSVSSYYIYNSNGLCTSEVRNNFDGTKDKYRHTWKDGSLVKTVHTEDSGAKNTIVFALDENGSKTGHTLTNAVKETQEGVYTYNELGGLAKLECTGIKPSVTTYEYNKHGDVIRQTVSENGTDTVTTFEYTYKQ